MTRMFGHSYRYHYAFDGGALIAMALSALTALRFEPRDLWTLVVRLTYQPTLPGPTR